MRLDLLTTRIATAAFATFVLIGTSACSGSKEDEEKLAVEGEEAEAQGSDAGATNEVAISEPAPEPEPAKIVEPEPVAPVQNAAVDKSRVVRYVTAEGVSIHSEAKDGSSVVGTLAKGDRVLVVEQNGWGKVGDGLFVKMNHLSAKGVGRERQPAQWKKASE